MCGLLRINFRIFITQLFSYGISFSIVCLQYTQIAAEKEESIGGFSLFWFGIKNFWHFVDWQIIIWIFSEQDLPGSRKFSIWPYPSPGTLTLTRRTALVLFFPSTATGGTFACIMQSIRKETGRNCTQRTTEPQVQTLLLKLTHCGFFNLSSFLCAKNYFKI